MAAAASTPPGNPKKPGNDAVWASVIQTKPTNSKKSASSIMPDHLNACPSSGPMTTFRHRVSMPAIVEGCCLGCLQGLGIPYDVDRSLYAKEGKRLAMEEIGID